MIFVAGLVIVLLDVLLFLIEPPRLWMSSKLHPFVDRKRGNPNPRQAEMIGAVEVSRLGPDIWPDGQPKLLRRGLNKRIETGSLRARNLYVLRCAQGFYIVVIQVQGNLAGRDRRMLGKVLRAEQSLLFRRYSRKQDRSPRPPQRGSE